MSDTPKCCKGCRYWLPLPSCNKSLMACHHLLLTGRRHGRTGDTCETRKGQR